MMMAASVFSVQHSYTMIAAFVILALTAVAQVQAFPGSDPIAEMVAVAPHHLNRMSLWKPEPVVCLLSFATEIEDLVKEAPDVSGAVSKAVSDLVSGLSNCKANSEWWVCEAQALRDAWQGSEACRGEAIEFVEKVLTLANEIKTKCF